MQLSVSQSVEDCVRDEKAAKQQLGTVWGSTFRPIRDRCEGEVLFSLGTRSYLDFISCMQIADDTKSVSPAMKGTNSWWRRNPQRACGQRPNRDPRFPGLRPRIEAAAPLPLRRGAGVADALPDRAE